MSRSPLRRFAASTPVFVFALTLIAACTRQQSAPPAAGTAASTAPVRVTTAPVNARQEPITIRATGTFTAQESSQVSPQVPGQVIATPVNVGDAVKAGDVIARLDDRDARARLAQAQATLQQAQATATNAKAEAERSSSLVKTGDISASDFQRLQTQVETANAQVAQAEAQVTLAQQAQNETVVHAPFAGHVSARPVAAGEYVTTASQIATIVKIEPIKLELQIPEADAAKINVGMAVTATVASYPGRQFTGKVTAKNPALNPESRALTVVAEFPNPDRALNPGMFATAAVTLSQTQQVLLVPRAAVFTPAGSPSAQVYILQDGKARLRVVQVGQVEGDVVPIASGVAAGDMVITSSPDKLFDGEPVTAG